MQRWEGDYEWASGLGDWWEREREEGTGDAVQRCKCAKVERWTGRIRGLVVGWTGGYGE